MQKRLEKLVSEKIAKKGTSAYTLISEICDLEKDTIRPVWTSGKGRFCKNIDYTWQVCDLLDKMRVKYEVGNDAPRGGKCGIFIKILNFEKDNEKLAERERQAEAKRIAEKEAQIKAMQEFKEECEQFKAYCKKNPERVDYMLEQVQIGNVKQRRMKKMHFVNSAIKINKWISYKIFDAVMEEL